MNSRLTSGFEEILVFGNIATEVLAQDIVPIERIAVPSEYADGLGPLPVKKLVRLVARAKKRPGRMLVLTDCDLTMPGYSSLFGYAHRKAGVAVVSTARLHADEPSRLQERLRNEIAHELGHLKGLEHCTEPACVMKPVVEASELDNRRDVACGRCPTAVSLKRRTLKTTAALLFLGILAVGLDWLVSPLFGPPLEFPFT